MIGNGTELPWFPITPVHGDSAAGLFRTSAKRCSLGAHLRNARLSLSRRRHGRQGDTLIAVHRAKLSFEPSPSDPKVFATVIPRERCTRYVSPVTYVCRGGLRDRSVASVLVVELVFVPVAVLVLVSVPALDLDLDRVRVVVGVFVASVP